MATDRNERYYKMNHEKRGLAVIFNHEFFSANGMRQRAGTKVDCENLAAQLKRLHFDVEVFTDYDLKEVHGKIGESNLKFHLHFYWYLCYFSFSFKKRSFQA